MNPSPTSPRTIFNEALEIGDPDERAKYLDTACGANMVLRQNIDELIHAEAAAGGFLTPRPGASAPTTPTVMTEQPGERVGSYKLLQKIGEGGCGVVYMAEQEEPFRRRVALKIIKLGMDTKTVVARFEAERQALALMEHPCIAKALDAGCTETGRPYFVMELVKGISITDYCDEKNLSTRERLDLFVQVCQAIQHAHQKGIVHRDIKPSNVLVTQYEGGPLPKIIDFGVAKAMQQPLTEKTLFTAFGHFIGTPAYMSPEQADLTAADIDTRSDIYSLGVLLYELLTGRAPFDPKALLRAGLDEIRRIIREEEPLRPSTKLSTLMAAELQDVAKHRQEDPSRLGKLLHGDLDWIVMKALDKDRSRRYDAASGLAQDVSRFLNEEPVLARPPSALYRFKKMVRRHKTAFAVATGVGGTLLLVLIFTLLKVVPVWGELLQPVFAERGQTLPAAIRFVLVLSEFLSRWFLFIALGTSAGVYFPWKRKRL